MSPPAAAAMSDDAFAALSLELVSHGYLTRPLLLSSLIASLPSLPPPSSSSSSSLKKHQEALVLRARALDQLSKLLWTLLERNDASRKELSESIERESRAVMEHDREHALRQRQERDNNLVTRELEIERARTKELEARLKQEQERHKHVKEELIKSRNALQFVKTQSLHDQKKREQEVNTLHLRLSKLGSTCSDPTSRIRVLNPAAPVSSSPSSVSPTSRLAGTRGGATATSRRNNHLAGATPPPPPSSPSIPHDPSALSLLESEIDLLKSSLEELEANRVLISSENLEFRQFVGQLQDWIETLLTDEPELNLDKDPRHLDYHDEHDHNDHDESNNGDNDQGGAVIDPDRQEARRLFERLRINREREQIEQVYAPPNPHLSDPPSVLLPVLDAKLYILRLTLTSSLRSIEQRLSHERRVARDAVEREIESRDEAIEHRERVEKELHEAQLLLQEGQLLVDEFTKNGGTKPRRSRLIGRDDSGDELPDEVVKDLNEKKRRNMNSKLATAEIEKPSSIAAAARPSVPSRSVQDFLGSLGLDTPAASAGSGEGGGGGGKRVLKSDKLINLAVPDANKEDEKRTSNRSASDSASSSSSSGTSRVPVEPTRSCSTSGATTTLLTERTTTREQQVGKQRETTTTFKKPKTTSSSSSASSVRPAPAAAAAATDATRSQPLSSILALSMSPPNSTTSDPLVSVQSRQEVLKSRSGAAAAGGGGGVGDKDSASSSKAVLQSSRAANKEMTMTTTTTKKTGTRSREELIKEKKMSLLSSASAAGQRGPRGRGGNVVVDT